MEASLSDNGERRDVCPTRLGSSFSPISNIPICFFLKKNDDCPSVAEFSPNGRHLAVGTSYGTIYFFSNIDRLFRNWPLSGKHCAKSKRWHVSQPTAVGKSRSKDFLPGRTCTHPPFDANCLGPSIHTIHTSTHRCNRMTSISCWPTCAQITTACEATGFKTSRCEGVETSPLYRSMFEHTRRSATEEDGAVAHSQIARVGAGCCSTEGRRSRFGRRP